MHVNTKADFKQERGHYGLCAAVSRAPEGSLQFSEIKKAAANLTSTEGTITLCKSIFVKKSPLVYFLQDILLNLGQLTKEFDPSDILITAYF